MDQPDNTNQQQNPPQQPAYNGDPLPDDNAPDLFAYARVLLSYWWIIGPLAVIGAVIGFVYCRYTQDIYRAQCRYEIFQNDLLKVGETPESDINVQSRDYNPIDRHILLLQGELLNEEVLDKLKSRWGVDDKHPLLKNLKVEIAPVREAMQIMMDIQVDCINEQFALAYITELLDAYQKLRQQESTQIHESTVRNLRVEKDKLAQELAEVQEELLNFERTHNLTFTEKKKVSEEQHLADVLAKHRILRTDRTVLDSQLPLIEDADPATLSDVLDLTLKTLSGTTDPSTKGKNDQWSGYPAWVDLEKEIIRHEAEYDYYLNKYKPDHPEMVARKEALDRLKRELDISAELALKQLKARRDALVMQESALLEAAEKIQTSIQMDADETAVYESMKSRADHLRELHDKVYSRIMDNSRVNKDLYFTRIVAGPAVLKNEQDQAIAVWPSKLKVIPASMFLITGAGVGIILLVFFRRARLFNYDSLSSNFEIPCLAGIPKIPRRLMKKNQLFLNELPKSSIASESYRTLRTSVDKYIGDGKVIMFTSAEPGDGKTFTSLNLANVCSWGHKRVLIVDGDFRRVSLRKVFPDAPKEGIVDCLKDESMDVKNVIVKDVIKNLDYLPAGHMDENAAELISHKNFGSVISNLRDIYDVIIIDCAPVGRVVDSILMSKHADAVVVVAMGCKTSVHAIKFAFNRLSGANVIGFVQNAVTEAARKYNYYGSVYYGYQNRYSRYFGSYSAYNAAYTPKGSYE